jgi:hypothetical protein
VTEFLPPLGKNPIVFVNPSANMREVVSQIVRLHIKFFIVKFDKEKKSDFFTRPLQLEVSYNTEVTSCESETVQFAVSQSTNIIISFKGI